MRDFLDKTTIFTQGAPDLRCIVAARTLPASDL
ncbi:hypothetical protein V475_03310 [Sphingobium baderi LL03]|uniref:Uncharacterized protein n=1 Tax=Sphingobium baderi LL03 TaxID=1114964 RepID=T0GDK5_9SPHN|nr:hypothetical protein L485_18830 [Sphingobium baderi LL03]KMS63373.1 hypothetical protein V475_03310 [Sphingobium baderi LL03]